MQSSHSLAFGSSLIEINLNVFSTNVQKIKSSLAPHCILLAVIKTDAYGHGVVPIGKEAVHAGATRLGVTKVKEGIALREAGIKVPIHLLRPIEEGEIEEILAYDLIPSVSSLTICEKLNQLACEQNKYVSVHLKVNTGLNRFGIEPEEALLWCKQGFQLERIYWEGIYTHFSHADEGDWKITNHQFHIFMEVIRELEKAGYTFPIHHVGASTITIERPDMHLDMVRPGVVLFGYPPAKRQELLVNVEPVLTLKTKLQSIREVKGKQSVSYGSSYFTSTVEKIGILPIGLGDGYPKALANRGNVLIRGSRAKIVGSIALDQTFIQVTHIPDVEVGDEVILIGSQGDESITAKNVAAWTDSNTDETLTRFMHRIPRIYTKD